MPDKIIRKVIVYGNTHNYGFNAVLFEGTRKFIEGWFENYTGLYDVAFMATEDSEIEKKLAKINKSYEVLRDQVEVKNSCVKTFIQEIENIGKEINQ